MHATTSNEIKAATAVCVIADETALAVLDGTFIVQRVTKGDEFIVDAQELPD